MTPAPRISASQRQLLFGLFACLAIVAGARGTRRLSAWYENERLAATELSGEATTARAFVGSAADARGELAVRASINDSLRRRLFGAPTWSSASANMAAHVSSAARTANVELGSIQLQLDSTATDGLPRRIGLVASARCDVHGLMRLLASLESGEKLIRVSALSITQPDVVGRAGPEALIVQLSLHALAVEEKAP